MDRGSWIEDPKCPVLPLASSRRWISPAQIRQKSRNILPKFGILIENLPNDSCILTGDFDRFFKRSDRFLIRSFMLPKWYHVDPRQTAVTVVPFRQHKAPD